ncbi:MAG: 3-deoxy-D-manno-octulosonic acid transferase [Acidobacteria bacterium]|nr:3-deoxy-D-manno-octulosonic acid transferase [Acidobacteriota bacterium]
MYFLYSLLTAAAAIILSPYFLWKGLREGKYVHNLRERLGYLRLVVSTTTATGQKLARERLSFADAVFFFPLDWARPVRRVLRALRPSLLVILETEIWPNVLRECRRAGVSAVFVNGRISERSFARYQKLLAASGSLSGFLRDILADASLFLMQSQPDAQRLLQLGAPEERVQVTGNLKFDIAPPAQTSIAAWLEEQITRQDRWPVLVAGSVVAGEEEEVLAAYDYIQRKWNRTLLILAPRKPARFDAAARIVEEDGWRVVRRSSIQTGRPLAEDADVFLLDSVGELAGLYRLADATFVGGSLVNSGGHNILESALYGKPPCFGASMENFRDMAQLFLQREAAVQVETGPALGHAWMRLIEDVAMRERMGRNAQALVAENGGATDRSLARIAEVLRSRGVSK